MGQTSHKHMRNDFIKQNNNLHHQYSQQGSIDYGNYTHDGFIEDEENSLPVIKSPSDNALLGMVQQKLTEQERRQEQKNKKIPCVFKYSGKIAKEVYLVGTFTNWKDKILMVKSDGDFVTIVDLPEGEHQYKFVVDGRWEHDSTQPTINDNFNGKNNVVSVQKSDFEVMDALENDQNQPSQNKQFQTNDDLSRSPPGEYTDEWPARGVNLMAIDKPPYLPPQLLNIVLNKDTSSRCEPALLPEPNHVMLKHLYALSIRDGVMVLSSTFRFKQKFITTCFYKPI